MKLLQMFLLGYGMGTLVTILICVNNWRKAREAQNEKLKDIFNAQNYEPETVEDLDS